MVVGCKEGVKSVLADRSPPIRRARVHTPILLISPKFPANSIYLPKISRQFHKSAKKFPPLQFICHKYQAKFAKFAINFLKKSMFLMLKFPTYSIDLSQIFSYNAFNLSEIPRKFNLSLSLISYQ